MEYCTVSFTWWLREDKIGQMVDMLLRMEQQDRHTVGFIKSITGKLVHYRLMVPLGRFNLGQLI